MISNRSMVEQLEGRQLLSATLTSGDSAPLVFQGTAVNGGGAVTDKLLMTVQRTADGFSDSVIITDDSGNVTSLGVSMNAAGKFSGTAADLTLAGRMNSAETKIAGNWALQGAHRTTRGALNLSLVPPPNTVLPTTNSKTTITDYTGTMTKDGQTTSNVKFEVIDTNGKRTGEVNVHNYDDQLVTIPFNISSTGVIAFTFSFTDQTNIVQGKLSDGGKLMTGSWTSINSDGTNGFGSFTASAD